MIKRTFLGLLFLALSAVLPLTNLKNQLIAATPTVSVADKFDEANLSQNAQAAYRILLTAETFEEAHLGYAGTLSKLVESFYIISQELAADQAFKSLLKKAKLAGQLYALIGLYKTDPNYFAQVVKEYQSSDKAVNMIAGCEEFPQKVSEIVDSSDQPYLAHDVLSGKYTAYFLNAGKTFIEEATKNSKTEN